jgi:hypothetical protein
MILRIILSKSSLQRFNSAAPGQSLVQEPFQMLLSCQRGSNKVLNLCPYKRGVPRKHRRQLNGSSFVVDVRN